MAGIICQAQVEGDTLGAEPAVDLQPPHGCRNALDDVARVTLYDPMSIWEIDMGDRYGRSDINEISIWDMC